MAKVSLHTDFDSTPLAGNPQWLWPVTEPSYPDLYGKVTGSIGNSPLGAADVDAYTVYLKSGSTFQAQTYTAGGLVDTAITLSFFGAVVSEDDNGAGRGTDSRLTYVVPNSGFYDVAVKSFAAASIGPYTLVVQNGIVSKDFSVDGHSDILWQGAAGEVTVWNFGAGASSIAAGTGPIDLGPSGSDWNVSGIADFNGNGKADLLLRGSDGQVTISDMDGLTSTPTEILRPGTYWSIADTGDFDGNGFADILWRGGNGEVAFWNYEASLFGGTFGAKFESNFGANPGTYWQVAGANDFNGDGRTDVLWRGESGEVTIWNMDRNIHQSTEILNPGNFWDVAATGDFSGDGYADILWRGKDGELTIWGYNSTGLYSAAPPSGGQPGAYWNVESTGDYNSDGKTDLLFRGASGEATLWLMDGTSHASVVLANPGDYWRAVA